MSFWTELKQLTDTHAKITANRIASGEESNGLLRKLSKPDTNIGLTIAHIIETQATHKLADAHGRDLFMKIVHKICAHVNEQKINLQQMEIQFREKKTPVYIIARPFEESKADKTFACLLFGEKKQFESNFVVTTDEKYYFSELKNFGYDSIENNFKNLSKTGFMTFLEKVSKDEILKQTKKVHPMDSFETVEEIQQRVKDLEKDTEEA